MTDTGVDQHHWLF